MIDRQARNKLAESIRALVSGIITNDEFEARAPYLSHDLAIEGIFRGGPWMLYDDLREYRLGGRNKLAPALKAEAARWVLFLKTDLEYEWPIQGQIQQLFFLLANIVTAGLFRFVYRRRLRTCGDLSVWPFRKRDDYTAALEQPHYLSTDHE